MPTLCSTPKKLMISRYEAFVKEDWKYIVETSINQTIEDFNNYNSTEWLKLDIIDAYEDVVEFKAYYRHNAKIHILHEKSNFVKVDGLWKYLDGELFNSKVQRNEACPCGSEKKFKRCCA